MATKKYLVTWQIDVEAETPRQAAEEALEVHRDPDSWATVFEVKDEDGNTTIIDCLSRFGYKETSDG